MIDLNVKTVPVPVQTLTLEDDVYVGAPVTPSLSPAASSLRQAQPYQAGEAVTEARPRGQREGVVPAPAAPNRSVDALWQRTAGATARTAAPLTSFDALPFTGALPPDPVGDVGPNHYVAMVNTVFAIYDKGGTQLVAPTPINALWSGAGGDCEAQNAGDPIVLYDALADRWILTQFSFGNDICLAVSQTPDPTGSYYRYEFTMPTFPDYFKLGVWGDAYYMGANENSYSAVAFDRNAILAGQSAGFLRFDGHSNLLMPADHDGSAPPPTGAPGLFYTFKDDGFHGGVDRIEVYAFTADFATPSNAAFTLMASIPITAFNYTVCGWFVFDCIPQPGTSRGLDSVSEWPMFRLQYRNFGTHETLVGNFAVDVSGSGHGGIRWFELRNAGSGWGLHQEGTLAPDNQHRFMGSIAMDGSGNIGLAYSTSGDQVYPSLRFTVRAAGDALGTMQGEASLVEGGGAQQSQSSRWGDYSALSVDPSDDHTFWFIGEYQPTTAGAGWRTRIGTFVYDPGGAGVTRVRLQPQGAPIVIGAGGGRYRYRGAVRNTGANTSNTQVWLNIEGPGGNYIQLRGPFALTLSPGQTRRFRMTQRIPGGASAGTYVQHLHAGAYPGAVDAHTTFTFDKAASKGATTDVVSDWAGDFAFEDDPVEAVPATFSLSQNYPNPFNPQTVIRFGLAEAGEVRLAVYNVLGQVVALLAEGYRQAGAHEVTFMAGGLPAGVYFYTLEAADVTQTRHMILMK